MNDDAPQISDHPERHRYELTLGTKLAAQIAYRLHGDVIDLVHTEVDPAYEGQGLASKLAKFAFDDARARHRRVIPTCEYIAAWLRKHPEYEDVVARAQ